nr:stalk domain-containing protein [uncultured Tyzzerella sp.]
MKKNIKKIIPMVAIATLMTTTVFANTNIKPNSSVVKENDKTSGIVTEVSEDKIIIGEKEININEETLIIDAAKGMAISYKDVMKNQSAYAYDDIIVANIPQDFKAPIVATIKETKKINDNTLEINIKENNNKYTITKDTDFNRIFGYNMIGIKSIPTFDELVEGSKIVLYVGDNNNLDKCLLTVFKEVAQDDNDNQTKENSIYVNGELLENATLIKENNKVLIPVRNIFEKLGFEIAYNANTKVISMTKGAQYITFATNADAYTFARMAPQPLGQAPVVKEGVSYVPVELFDLIGMDIKLTDNNVLYVGENLQETEEKSTENTKDNVAAKKNQIIIKEIDEKNNTITVEDDKRGIVVLNIKDLKIDYTTEDKQLMVGQALNVEYGEIMTASEPPINIPKSVKVVDKFSYGEILNVEKDDKNNTRVLFKDEEMGEVVLNLAPDFKVNFNTEDKELKKGQTLEVVLGRAMTMSLPPMTNPKSVSVINLKDNSKEQKEDTNENTLKGIATIKSVDKENETILVTDEKIGDVVLNINDDVKIEYKNGTGTYAYNWMVAGQKIEVEYSPIMTRSLPPINNPVKILVLN